MRFHGCFFCHECLKIGLRSAKLSEIFEIRKPPRLCSNKKTTDYFVSRSMTEMSRLSVGMILVGKRVYRLQRQSNSKQKIKEKVIRL